MKPSLLLIFSMCLMVQSTVYAQKTVAIDNWYNRETNPKTGKIFHYTWDDETDGGFSMLGDVFKKEGALLQTIGEAPAAKNLKGVGVYIIVDPDTTSENPNPNYVGANEIKAIRSWVKKGGVLVLMSNDGPNAEFTHFNRLASEFGIFFKAGPLKPVEGRNWQMGAETNLPDHPLFEGVKKIYMKNTSSIAVSGSAKPLVNDSNTGEVMIAEAYYGKGYVLAIGDPWLYNEYVTHVRLTPDFDNDKAMVSFARLLLSKAKH